MGSNKDPFGPGATVPAPPGPSLPAAEDAAARPTMSPTSAAVTPRSVILQSNGDFELPERLFFDQLEERARRADLMVAMLAAGGISPADAVLVLQASLGAVVTSATQAGLPSLAHLATALRDAVGNLGLAPPLEDDLRVVDTLVYDESELQRDLVALAVESHGHTVRCAASYEELLRELDERKPALLITEVEHENARARLFIRTLKELLENRRVPFVIFSSLPSSELDQLARESGARRHISKDRGLDGLIAELRAVFRDIVAVRVTGRQPAFRLER